MKKQVFISMCVLTVFCFLLTSVALCLIFYGKYSADTRIELKNIADVFREETSQDTADVFLRSKRKDIRITLIAQDGTVTFDSIPPAANMENHADREEVISALASGVGESDRYSETRSEVTHYYAVSMADGSVFRVSKAVKTALGMFFEALPALLLLGAALLVAEYFLSKKLTKHLLEPINNVDMNASTVVPPYEELEPFAAKFAERRKKLRRELNEISSRKGTVEAILDNMSEGIILVGDGGVVLTVNKCAAAFFDVPFPTSGKNILELFRNADILEHLRSALAGNREEMNLQRDDRTYHALFSPVLSGGAIILFMDVTEAVKAETLRREFSANVSHELKTPLTTIYGHAEMLYNGMVKDEDKRSFYGHIKDETGRLIALIEDILMISRLDEGAGQELFEEVDLSEVIAVTVESITPKAQANGVTFRVSAENAFMRANRSQMYELLYNLIDNAIKYNKQGGTVSINAVGEGETLTLTVADSGIGIPKQAQERIFERFYRVDRSRSKKTGGTGLGLAIAKHIVLVHRGSIELSSEVGKGTTITFRFAKLQNHPNQQQSMQ